MGCRPPVAATGNAGYYMTPGGAGLTSPARDPYVISVGATDNNKTTATTDDVVASFSSGGVVATGGTKNPDLVAPGKSIIGLAVPGSFIDQAYGAAGAAGAVTGGYMRGSGTSQATAVVSGAAALILQKHPTWTNNQVKAVLTTTAKPLTAGTLSPAAQGKGRLDLAKAFGVTSVAAAYSYTSSSGAGSLLRHWGAGRRDTSLRPAFCLSAGGAVEARTDARVVRSCARRRARQSIRPRCR